MMKKILISMAIILLSAHLSYNKLDFLFFKVNICNNTDIKMDVSILDTFYLPGAIQKIFGLHEGYLKKHIFMGSLKPNQCSGYISMNRLSNYPIIQAEIWKKIGKNILPYKDCSPTLIDTNGIRKMKFGTYDFSIIGYEFIPNTYKCKLHIKRVMKI